MPTYDLELSKKATKAYNRADAAMKGRLDKCFQNLKKDPYNHPSSKGLSGELAGLYRYRVGNWRVVYEVNEDDVLVIVLIIGSRGQVYR